MKRSDVVEHVVLVPMRIKTQWEGDKLIAVMPAWQLPTQGLLVEGNNMADAMDKLEHRMQQYWGAPSNAQVKRPAERSEDCPLEPVVGQSDGAAQRRRRRNAVTTEVECLVGRLRMVHGAYDADGNDLSACAADAADEIERLRIENSHLRIVMIDGARHLEIDGDEHGVAHLLRSALTPNAGYTPNGG